MGLEFVSNGYLSGIPPHTRGWRKYCDAINLNSPNLLSLVYKGLPHIIAPLIDNDNLLVDFTIQGSNLPKRMPRTIS